MKRICGFIRCLFCLKRHCHTRFTIGKKSYSCSMGGEFERDCPKDREK